MSSIITTRKTYSALAASGFIMLVTALPAAAITDPGPPLPASADPSSTAVHEVAVDEGHGEFLHVGLGALGGMAVAGVGAAAIGARRQSKHDRVPSA
jgi:hypothetical protein